MSATLGRNSPTHNNEDSSRFGYNNPGHYEAYRTTESVTIPREVFEKLYGPPLAQLAPLAGLRSGLGNPLPVYGSPILIYLILSC